MTTALVNRIPSSSTDELGYLDLIYVSGVVDVEKIDLLAAHVDQHLRPRRIEGYVGCRQLKIGDQGVFHRQMASCVVLNTVGVHRLLFGRFLKVALASLKK